MKLYFLKGLQGSLLVALLVTSFTNEGVSATDLDQVCSAEAKVNLSKLAGLRQHHALTVDSGYQLEREYDMTEKRMEQLKIAITITANEEEESKQKLQNTTTPEIEELEAMGTCGASVPLECCEIKQMLPSAESGLYAIKDPCSDDEKFNSGKLVVYCDMETDGGGWTVIQRRNAEIGYVNFTRSFKDYEDGFGDLNGEFWIGLKNIYQLTNQQRMELRTRVWNDSTTSVTWNYPYFSIYGPSSYRLSSAVGPGEGDGEFGPFASNQNISAGRHPLYFMTYDRYYYFNYNTDRMRCGYTDQAGWWYYTCDYANLNGRHSPTDLPGTRPLRQRLVWKTATGYDIYTHSEMKIRPTACSGA